MKKIKIQILILQLTDFFLEFFSGNLHAQKRHQKQASATSHFLTSACGKPDVTSQKEPGK